MGNGAAINLHPPHMVDDHFKSVISSKAARLELFNTLTEYRCDDHIEFKDRLSLKKLVAYFNDEKRTVLKDLKLPFEVLSSAFRFTVKKKKHHQLLTKKDFHSFIPILFLFSKLWDIFDEADNTVIDDDKVFKAEFMKIKPLLGKIPGVEIVGEVSDADWEAEFVRLDKNKDGYVSFQEFCKYSIDRICKPFDYATEFTLYDDEVDGEEEGEEATGDVGKEKEALPFEGDSVKETAVDTKPHEKPVILGADLPVRSGLQIASIAESSASATAVTPAADAPLKGEGVAAPPP